MTGLRNLQEGEATSDDNRRLRRLVWRILRRLVRWTGLLSVAWLILVTVAFHFIGHRNPTVAFMLYLPPWLWALPCIVALLPCLLLDTLRSGMALVVSIVFYFGPGLGYRWQWHASQHPSNQVHTLSILTYNRGQSQGTSLQPFKNSMQPDLLTMQDAGGRAARYLGAEGYREFGHAMGAGEYTLLSRFPILGSRLITCSQGGASPQPVVVAARFEVQWRRRVVVYSVHLPTHRGMLLGERRGGFLTGVIGLPGTPWAEKRRIREDYWNTQLQIVQELASQIRNETDPVIVAGDFNAPPFGPMYDAFSDFLEDGHQRAGSGYGFSFPGETHNPLAFSRPWLRLDYIFYSPAHWRTLRHVTESSRASQHLAVFAELQAIDVP